MSNPRSSNAVDPVLSGEADSNDDLIAKFIKKSGVEKFTSILLNNYNGASEIPSLKMGGKSNIQYALHKSLKSKKIKKSRLNKSKMDVELVHEGNSKILIVSQSKKKDAPRVAVIVGQDVINKDVINSLNNPAYLAKNYYVHSAENNRISITEYLPNTADKLAAKSNKSDPKKIDDAIDLGVQISAMLSDLSRHNIIWSDLKAENILIRNNGKLAIADLKNLKHIDSVNTFLDGTTPEYLPSSVKKDPDNFIDMPINTSDKTKIWNEIYSYQMAIILHHQLTGKKPELGSDFKFDFNDAVFVSTKGLQMKFIISMLKDNKMTHQDASELLSLVGNKEKFNAHQKVAEYVAAHPNENIFAISSATQQQAVRSHAVSAPQITAEKPVPQIKSSQKRVQKPAPQISQQRKGQQAVTQDNKAPVSTVPVSNNQTTANQSTYHHIEWDRFNHILNAAIKECMILQNITHNAGDTDGFLQATDKLLKLQQIKGVPEKEVNKDLGIQLAADVLEMKKVQDQKINKVINETINEVKALEKSSDPDIANKAKKEEIELNKVRVKPVDAGTQQAMQQIRKEVNDLEKTQAEIFKTSVKNNHN